MTYRDRLTRFITIDNITLRLTTEEELVLPPRSAKWGTPLENNSPELIEWLQSPAGETWSSLKHRNIKHHALIEDIDDLPHQTTPLISYMTSQSGVTAEYRSYCECHPDIPEVAWMKKFEWVKVEEQSSKEHEVWACVMMHMDNGAWIMSKPALDGEYFGNEFILFDPSTVF